MPSNRLALSPAMSRIASCDKIGYVEVLGVSAFNIAVQLFHLHSVFLRTISLMAALVNAPLMFLPLLDPAKKELVGEARATMHRALLLHVSWKIERIG
jgi:hypothetical protein